MALIKDTLLAIDAPHFYAGCFIRNGKVISTAPILKYMMGWREDTVKKYCAKKNWRIRTPNIIGSVQDS